MKIVIVGNGVKVNFLADSLIKKGHQLVIINNNQDECERLSEFKDIMVIYGEGSKKFILEDANIYGFDLMIAVKSNDPDNLVICLLAKKVFGIPRAFATVSNPRNVEVFKKLGINTAVSATYVLSNIIEQMAFADQVINFMPLENENLQLLEVLVENISDVCGKQIMDLGLPNDTIIGCILRGNNTIVPNGRTEIHEGDKLMIFTSASSYASTLSKLTGGARR
ncbi:NAD-binding protein [Sedimentibacter sp.]|uniref:potassium channel family protein n=1 Tax=Sedimentibacter sp. TaxID=1960295 RepID=UPI0028ABE276|nr:NAD-binding protein [Sedimentibacter sp.]